MPVAFLSAAERRMALSRAWARAVAAGAGYAAEDCDFERDGIDIRVFAAAAMRPALGLQLQAAADLGQPRGGAWRFPLKRRNFDLLRMPSQAPRLLVVLDLPEDESRWPIIARDAPAARLRAWWASLKDCEDKPNRISVTVKLPEDNAFDVEGLGRLMDRAREGAIR